MLAQEYIGDMTFGRIFLKNVCGTLHRELSEQYVNSRHFYDIFVHLGVILQELSDFFCYYAHEYLGDMHFR